MVIAVETTVDADDIAVVVVVVVVVVVLIVLPVVGMVVSSKISNRFRSVCFFLWIQFHHGYSEKLP